MPRPRRKAAQPPSEPQLAQPVRDAAPVATPKPAITPKRPADPEVLLPIHEWLKLVRDELRGLREDLAKRG